MGGITENASLVIAGFTVLLLLQWVTYSPSALGIHRSALSGLEAHGAEKLSLWELRGSPLSWRRLYFDTFMFAVQVNPRAAMLGARLLGGSRLDELMFGASSAAAASPFSWAKALTLPGVLAAQYQGYFLDTDPVLAFCAQANFLALDVLFLSRLAVSLLFTARSPLAMLRSEFLGCLWCAVGSLLCLCVTALLAYPLWLLPPLDWLLYCLCSLALYALNIHSLSVLAREVCELVQLRPLLKRPLQALALAAAQSPLPLFSATDWKALYTEGSFIGKGGFAYVCEGTHTATCLPVALKHFSLAQRLDEATSRELAVLQLAQRALGPAGLLGVQGLLQSKLQEHREGMAATLRGIAEQEATALRAVKALGSPCFLDMLSSHCQGGSYTIVTSRAGPTFDRAMPPLPPKDRLLALRRTAEALATLHAAGLVHRDIKADNVATHPQHPTQPIVLDLGLLRLPTGCREDALELSCCRDTAPPEFVLAHVAALPSEMGAADLAQLAGQLAVTDRPVEYHQGRDVFALALLITQVLYGKNPWKAYLAASADTRQACVRYTPARAGQLLQLFTPAQGSMLDLLSAMLQPLPQQRPTMEAVAAHPAFSDPLSELHVTPASGAAPGPTPSLGLLYDSRDARGLLHRMFLRHSRLALLRDLVRQGQGGGEAAGGRGGLPLDFLAKVHQALGRKKAITKGCDFDAVLERAGLVAAVLPIDHNDLFQVLDQDESGSVDRRELLSGLAFLLAPQLSAEQQLALVFEAFDVDGSGALSREELRAMLEAYGLPHVTASAAEAAAAEQRLGEVFADLDTDSSGAVSLEELRQGLRKGGLLSIEAGAYQGVQGGAPESSSPSGKKKD